MGAFCELRNYQPYIQCVISTSENLSPEQLHGSGGNKDLKSKSL